MALLRMQPLIYSTHSVAIQENMFALRVTNLTRAWGIRFYVNVFIVQFDFNCNNFYSNSLLKIII